MQVQRNIDDILAGRGRDDLLVRGLDNPNDIYVPDQADAEEARRRMQDAEERRQAEERRAALELEALEPHDPRDIYSVLRQRVRALSGGAGSAREADSVSPGGRSFRSRFGRSRSPNRNAAPAPAGVGSVLPVSTVNTAKLY